MRNNKYYVQLRQIVFDNNYTIQQVQNANRLQIANLIGVDKKELLRTENIKRLLISELHERDNEADKEIFQTNLAAAVKTKWPDCELTRTKIDGRRAFIFWPDGKPEGF